MVIKRRTYKKILTGCWLFIAVLIIGTAIFSSLFRALTPWATRYKAQVENQLSLFLGQPVSVAEMQTGWYWFEPVLKLNRIIVQEGNNKTIELKKLQLGINLLSSLLHWQIQPGVLYIDGLHLTIRQKNDEWKIEGVDKLSAPSEGINLNHYRPILEWIFNQDKIIVNNFSSTVYLQNGQSISIKNFNLLLVEKIGGYRIKSTFTLGPDLTTIEWLSELSLDPDHLEQSAGRAFLSIKHLNLAQWQAFLPNDRFEIKTGNGDIQAWFDWEEGRAEAIQGHVHFNDLSGQDKSLNKQHKFSYFNANFAWKTRDKGWELSADHLTFRMDQSTWPENKLLLSNDGERYSLYVEHIILDSLFPFLAEKIKPWDIKRLHGFLDNTQIKFSNHSIDSLLTQFSNLGWEKSDVVVDNVKGVLNGQLTEGRLELDSEDIKIHTKNKAPLVFQTINAGVAWKESKTKGLDISIDRLILERPDLQFKAEGTIEELTPYSAGPLSLAAKWSAENAEQWLAYLPSHYLKKRLERWLKNNIKKIDKMVTEVNVKGKASDFPFDEGNGEFTVKSNIQGADITFNEGWPLTKNMNAFLSLNHRELDINIIQANLQTIPIQNGNIRIEDIGHDREIMLGRIGVDTDAQEAQNYIFSSPLKKKLSALKLLELKGKMKLDLRLEIPLYTEEINVFALGDMVLKNNDVIFNHYLKNIEFNEVNGFLQFDEKRIMHSQLEAMMKGYPVTVLIQSHSQPKPYTKVKIKGTTTVDILQQTLHWPLLSLMDGKFSLEGVLTLTDEPGDLDQLLLNTSLQGMSINLPPPLGKTAQSPRPLSLEVNYNVEKAVRVRMDYDHQVNADLWFLGLPGQLEVKKGEIQIGGKPAEATKAGVHVLGVLPLFDLSQWTDIFEKFFSSSESQGDGLAIDEMDLLLKEVKFDPFLYPNMRINATKIKPNEWSVAINQADILANLHYLAQSRLVRGHFKKLYIKMPQAKDNYKPLAVSVKTMPNLDLKIDALRWNELDVGEVTLNTTQQKQAWQINRFEIGTPHYQLFAHGQWVEQNQRNNTQLQAELEIHDLAKTLEGWRISPAVSAEKGLLIFEGGWPGTVFDFSLAKIWGQMAINFKNGRITDLSPETEEKLGLGKLLSILSLQTIPRRLKLDFSDLSEKGYSFDEFNGTFKITDGLMRTEDSFINGPIAYASMKGDLDIAKQVYNLMLHVSPHVTASLPVVATIAGGPIAGIATWVVSKIINKGMQKISGYTYKITGPWKQPIVHQVSIIKKKK